MLMFLKIRLGVYASSEKMHRSPGKMRNDVRSWDAFLGDWIWSSKNATPNFETAASWVRGVVYPKYTLQGAT